MPLLSFWKNSRDEVLKMTVEQVVASAGDGNLRDGSGASQEFRNYLQEVPSDFLFDYARYCLENPFNKSGLVLQDTVNELGRRLDFEVENGLYQGRKTAVGFDGLWCSESDPDILIEVKTTDYVTVSLDKIAAYRGKLGAENRIKPNSSMLIVVGREDTGALEAQVRGSRYAWDMRLISGERLIKLVQIKEKSDDPNTVTQIRQLLRPFEYTKIDRIIDVIFTTAVDVETQQITDVEAVEQETSEQGGYREERAEPDLLNKRRQEAVDVLAQLKGKKLIRHSRTLFWSSDKKLRVCCTVSKRYERDYQPYWYAYRPAWDKFLSEGEESYFVLALMDKTEAYALPFSWLEANKKHLNVAQKGDKWYWHVALTTMEDLSLAVNLSRIGSKTPLGPFSFSWKAGVPSLVV
jgi:hypothetical protein